MKVHSAAAAIKCHHQWRSMSPSQEQPCKPKPWHYLYCVSRPTSPGIMSRNFLCPHISLFDCFGQGWSLLSNHFIKLSVPELFSLTAVISGKSKSHLLLSYCWCVWIFWCSLCAFVSKAFCEQWIAVPWLPPCGGGGDLSSHNASFLICRCFHWPAGLTSAAQYTSGFTLLQDFLNGCTWLRLCNGSDLFSTFSQLQNSFN